MRVRISYGMDLSNATATVHNLLVEAIEKLESELSTLKNGAALVKSDEYAKTTAMIIDNVRKQVSDIDNILADSHAILDGYIRVIENGIPTAQENDADLPTEDSTDVREG